MEVSRFATLALAAALLASACPRKPNAAHDAGSASSAGATSDASAARDAGTGASNDDAPPRKAALGRTKLIPITKHGVGPMGAGAVNRAAVARVFLDGLSGNIEETNDLTENEVVGRAYTVKRGEGVDVVTEAIVHADTSGNLYSVEVVAPIAEARGVVVGDALGKALGDEPVKCARGMEERSGAVYCARRSEPQILFEISPRDIEVADAPVPVEKMRAQLIRAIIWNPHAK